MNHQATRLINKAYYHVEKHNYHKAASLLKEAAKADPEDEEVLAYLGEAYLLTKEYELALETFAKRDKSVLKANPLTAYIEGYRGRVYLEQGNTEKAEELIKFAIDEDAKDPEIFYSLALLKLFHNKNEEAREALRKIDVLDPSFYYKRISMLRSQLKEMENQTESSLTSAGDVEISSVGELKPELETTTNPPPEDPPSESM